MKRLLWVLGLAGCLSNGDEVAVTTTAPLQARPAVCRPANGKGEAPVVSAEERARALRPEPDKVPDLDAAAPPPMRAPEPVPAAVRARQERYLAERFVKEREWSDLPPAERARRLAELKASVMGDGR